MEDVYKRQVYAGYQYFGIRADGTHKVRNYTTPGTGKLWVEVAQAVNGKNWEKEMCIRDRANNIDDNSPLGVSIYANALSTLKALDICYDSFIREFRLGKKRIIVPAQCIRTVINPQTQEMVRYFDASDETYEALHTDNSEDLKITDNSVELRVDEHVAAINAFLSILCLQVGFSAGTFTFDRAQGLKTATEAVSYTHLDVYKRQ